MSRAAQVAGKVGRQKANNSLMLCAAALSIGFAISGCASGGLEMLGVGTDENISTGSVPDTKSVSAARDGTEVWSDEMTIRNAVSSANLAELNGGPLSWANADTGSQGAVTQIRESEKNGLRCRKFVASRESFDGVSLYAGEACLQGNGLWLMREFGPAPA